MGEPWYLAISGAKSDFNTNKYNMNHALDIFLERKKMQCSFLNACCMLLTSISTRKGQREPIDHHH